ncbi:hypothetical protein CLF_100459 [Clonorchis sinensis]|uniref:Uncharacterized protein n=1 Tax=Clonorchis sinensis TaxID=79923 RepID=G7Y3H9_CLOSI|nr:hypothetical protein CLF_100459 [Clonorchis sinensis]
MDEGYSWVIEGARWFIPVIKTRQQDSLVYIGVSKQKSQSLLETTVSSRRGIRSCEALHVHSRCIGSDGGVTDEDSERICRARVAFENLKHLWRQIGVSLNTKECAYHAALLKLAARTHYEKYAFYQSSPFEWPSTTVMKIAAPVRPKIVDFPLDNHRRTPSDQKTGYMDVNPCKRIAHVELYLNHASRAHLITTLVALHLRVGISENGTLSSVSNPDLVVYLTVIASGFAFALTPSSSVLSVTNSMYAGFMASTLGHDDDDLIISQTGRF